MAASTAPHGAANDLACVSSSQGQRVRADNGSLANLTDITLVSVENSTQTFKVHSTLLGQASKWFAEREQEIDSNGPPPPQFFGPKTTLPRAITIPAPHTSRAVDIFVKYIYQKDVVPHTTLFLHHGFEAFLLSQFLDSADFARCCERALEHALTRTTLKPSLSQLQTMLGVTNLSPSLRKVVLGNVATRIIESTYPFQKGEEYFIDGSTWQALCLTIASQARGKNTDSSSGGFSFGTQQTTTSSPFLRLGSNANAANASGATFGSTSALSPAFGLHLRGQSNNNHTSVDTPSKTSDNRLDNPSLSNATSGPHGSNNNSGGLFAQNQHRPSGSNNVLGVDANSPNPAFGSSFPGSSQSTNRSNGGLFGQGSGNSLFGQASRTPLTGNSLFGQGNGSSLFGNTSANSANNNVNPTRNLFGQQQTQIRCPTNLFGQTTTLGTNNNNTNWGGCWGRTQASTGFPSSNSTHNNDNGNLGMENQTVHCGEFGKCNHRDLFGHPLGCDPSNGVTQSQSGLGGVSDPNRSTMPVQRREFGDCYQYQYGLGYGTEAMSQPFTEKEANGMTSVYQHICVHPNLQKFSPEELRLTDYNNHRFSLPQVQQSQSSTGCDPSNTQEPSKDENTQTEHGNSESTTAPNAKQDPTEEFSKLVRELKEQLMRIQKDTEDLKVRQTKQEQCIRGTDIRSPNDDVDSNTSTPVNILTPTSSADASPAAETEIPATTESEDFVNIESRTPAKKVHFAEHETLNTASTATEDTNIKNRLLTDIVRGLSPEAHKIYKYITENFSTYVIVTVDTLATVLQYDRQQVLVSGIELMSKGLVHVSPKTSQNGDVGFLCM